MKTQRIFTDSVSVIKSECNRLTASGMSIVILHYDTENEPYRILSLSWEGKTKKILVVRGPRMSKQNSGMWFFNYPEVLKKMDAVYLFYDQAGNEGARTITSGNKDKDHFRRLCRVKDLTQNGNLYPNVYDEINSRFSEKNVENLFNNKPLLLRGWGVEG